MGGKTNKAFAIWSVELYCRLLYLNMSGDSQATFSSAVKSTIRQKYGNRCVICLTMLPEGHHCAHLFDQTSIGANQVRIHSDTTSLY